VQLFQQAHGDAWFDPFLALALLPAELPQSGPHPSYTTVHHLLSKPRGPPVFSFPAS
jgi:hypothetical protein